MIGVPMAWSEAPAARLLEGVRIVSFGTFIAGNVCALLLAELGADVIKIEWPGHPEPLRAYDYPGRPRPTEPSGVRTTVVFSGLSRSVRSVGIDMQDPAGRRVLRELVSVAEVVIENLGPGTLEAWECGHPDLLAARPGLVMLSMSGYGRTGPLSGYRSYASNIGNFIGLTDSWAPDGTYADFAAALQGANAVVAALNLAGSETAPVHIDLAQTEATACLLSSLYLTTASDGRSEAGVGERVPGSLLSCVLACSGADQWAAVEIQDSSDWTAACELMELADLCGSPGAEPDALERALAAWAQSQTPLQVAWRLQSVGVAAAPVQSNEDLWRDPQLRERGAFVELEHPDLGATEFPGPVGRLSRTPARVTRRGPRLGEHTREVLGEWLGWVSPRIDEEVRNGVIWEPPGSDRRR